MYIYLTVPLIIQRILFLYEIKLSLVHRNTIPCEHSLLYLMKCIGRSATALFGLQVSEATLDLERESSSVGLKINTKKTKVLSLKGESSFPIWINEEHRRRQ